MWCAFKRLLISNVLLTLLLTSPVSASRDLASGDYIDVGASANLAQTHSMTIAAMINVDAITGSNQDIISRIVTAGTNGWEFLIQATTGNLYYRLAESDDAIATSTTAPSSGTWFGVAVVVSGVDGAGNAHFVRYTPSTGTTATQEVGFFNAPSATGTFKGVIGGAWTGSLSKPYAGLVARVGVWAGVTLTDDQLRTWFCTGVAASGGDGLWELAGTSSPEPDTSGNGYDGTLNGTTQGAAPTACPGGGASRRTLLGVGP